MKALITIFIVSLKEAKPTPKYIFMLDSMLNSGYGPEVAFRGGNKNTLLEDMKFYFQWSKSALCLPRNCIMPLPLASWSYKSFPDKMSEFNTGQTN